jgi:hypothetical protein
MRTILPELMAGGVPPERHGQRGGRLTQPCILDILIAFLLL